MKVAIVVFPGSNCDRDISWAIKNISGKKPDYLWHKEKNFTNYDLIILPGGFSYGDYLRCCLLYTSPSPRDRSVSRMPSSA